MLRRLAIAGVAVVAGVILVTTLAPREPDETACALGMPCTLGHVLAFGALGVFAAALYATSGIARRSPRRALAMVLLLVWAFAAFDEMAQGRVGRDASLNDWLADMVGFALGLIGGSVLLRALLREAPRAPARPAKTSRAARRGARAARR